MGTNKSSKHLKSAPTMAAGQLEWVAAGYNLNIMTLTGIAVGEDVEEADVELTRHPFAEEEPHPRAGGGDAGRKQGHPSANVKVDAGRKHLMLRCAAGRN